MGVPDYYAFIDESGSEGDPDKTGGFEFLNLVAVVVRTRALQCLSDVWDRHRRIERKSPGRIWQGFKETNSDASKYLAASLLAVQPIKYVSVIGHKPSMFKLDHEAQHGDLYFLLSQYLIERISWAVRDANAKQGEADPRVRIVFSERKNTAYDQLIQYVQFVQENRGKVESNADWRFIDRNEIVARPHHTCTPLKSADFIAGAIASAIELNKKYGVSDDRFMIPLHRICYAYNGKRFKNGLKLFPSQAEKALPNEDRFRWMKTHYMG